MTGAATPPDTNPAASIDQFRGRVEGELPHMATRAYVAEQVGILRGEIKDVKLWTYKQIIAVAAAAGGVVSLLVSIALLWARLVPPP
ncbi:MAG: hypothetical protein F4Z08_07250 [Chloroflexi bacterium]|nr:hypothetical protein [Chloroflexota bacterium]